MADYPIPCPILCKTRPPPPRSGVHTCAHCHIYKANGSHSCKPSDYCTSFATCPTKYLDKHLEAKDLHKAEKAAWIRARDSWKHEQDLLERQKVKEGKRIQKEQAEEALKQKKGKRKAESTFSPPPQTYDDFAKSKNVPQELGAASLTQTLQVTREYMEVKQPTKKRRHASDHPALPDYVHQLALKISGSQPSTSSQTIKVSGKSVSGKSCVNLESDCDSEEEKDPDPITLEQERDMLVATREKVLLRLTDIDSRILKRNELVAVLKSNYLRDIRGQNIIDLLEDTRKQLQRDLVPPEVHSVDD